MTTVMLVWLIAILSVLSPLGHAQTTKRCLQDPDRQRLAAWAKAGKPPIVLDGYTWNSGSIYNHVLKILAEEVLSYPITFAAPDADKVYNWDRLVNGSVHMSLGEIWTGSPVLTFEDVWITTDERKKYITDFALSSNRKIESAGANGQNALSGWFAPQWAVDAWPAMASFRGLRDASIARLFSLNDSVIANLPKPKFAQPSTNRTDWFATGNRALILTILPSYANDPNPALVRNLNLQADVQYSGEDDAYAAEVWRSLTLMGVPMVFSLWQPHQIFSEYLYRRDDRFKMVRIALPEFDERTCGKGDALNCDFQPSFPQKILSSSLQSLSDEMYWLAKQIALTNEDLNGMLGEISYRNSSLEDVACAWVKNNTNTWNSWIWFRKCDSGCGVNGYCQFNQCICKEGWEGAKCDVQKVLRFVDYTAIAGIAFLAITVLLILSVVALLVLLVLKRHQNVVKAQGFMFNVIILCSLALAYAGPFTAAGSPTVTTCSLKIMLPCLSFVILMSALLVRNYRLIAIFGAKKRVENVTDSKIVLLMLPFILVELALLAALPIMGKPSIGEMQDAATGRWILACKFETTIIMPVLVAYKVFIVLLAIVLAYRTRNIPDRFGESKSIALAIYNLAVVSASFMVVLFVVKVDETLWFVIYSLTVLLAGAVVQGIFFGRIVYYIFFRKGSAGEDWNEDGSGSKSGSGREGTGARPAGSKVTATTMAGDGNSW
ncbi:Metabotropic glutamate receptor 3 [Phlyctochytrium bullatum]|nr:Metabotropic glutamate receptor 3 [Phlyctochytrium bullatum]